MLTWLNFLLFYFVSGADDYLVHALFFLWPSCATVWYSNMVFLSLHIFFSAGIGNCERVLVLIVLVHILLAAQTCFWARLKLYADIMDYF